MRRLSVLWLFLLMALAGCERSISDSGYRGDGHSGGNPFYRGELSPYDILGIDLTHPVSDDEIRKAMVSRQNISVKKGSAVMLVQSGAMFPDPEMVAALERYYTVSSFTGIPLTDTRRPDGPPTANAPAPPAMPYSQLFRLAAAKGGFETILVYWGVLESGVEGLGTKGVSWIPVIGGIIPDESQRMRIRLMVAVIDTRTGQWESFNPEPFLDEAISNQHSRAASDQEQVLLLKTKAYQAAAQMLVDRFSR